MKYQSSVDALGGRLALHFHPGFRRMYELLGLSATRFEASYLQALKKSIGVSDQEVLSDEQVCQSFLEASRECFRQGAEGLVADATMLYETWPFDMTKAEAVSLPSAMRTRFLLWWPAILPTCKPDTTQPMTHLDGPWQ